LADIVIITDDNPRTENPSDIINDIVSGINHGREYRILPDRREAISYAVGIASENDIVLIAGKGHENYQEIGENKYPFDDREVIMALDNSNRHYLKAFI
jgi:UDP-N-acetylmuramoyl-L-alanyl-D-glutamate--2,6-diaminopimelate ligase